MLLVRSAPGVWAIQQRGGSHRIHVGRFRLADDDGSLIQRRDRQLEVEHGRRSGIHGDGLLLGFEFRLRDGNFVIAHRHGGEGKLAVIVRLRGLRVIRRNRLQLYRCSGQRPMLRVVNHSLNSSENRCV